MSDFNFEKSLEDLEAMVEILENSDVSLEESINIFEKGLKLSSLCSEKINEAEKQINQLIYKNGEYVVAPFNIES